MTLARVVEVCRFAGIPVVPTRADRKAPFEPYAHHYDSGEVPGPDLFERHPDARSAQALMGQPFGFIAIDLDGPEAREVWSRWVADRGGRDFRTWVTHSGGGGRHVWFRIPDWWGTRPIRKAVLWKGEGEHSAIERLGDRSLVMLPGSIHPETGNPYRFEEGRSPFEVQSPCVAPAWVMYLTPVDRPARERRPAPGWLDRLPDKVGLARSWGLKFTGIVRNGWHECHAFDRADRTPSAAVHEESGYYVDLGSGTRMSLIQLGVAAGPYTSESDAMEALRRSSI